MKITDKAPTINPITSSMISELERSEAVKDVASVASGDRVQVSQEAMMKSRVSQIVEAVKASPDIDHHRVSVLKQAIADGNYSPDLKQVAEKMINEDLFFTDL